MLLEVSHLAVKYDKVQAIWDVSLTISEGEIVTVIGANGAGKTTTLRAISGIVRPSHGSITFGNNALDGMPGYKRVRLGISHIPEGRHVFAGMSVEENLLLGGFVQRGVSQSGRTKPDLSGVYERFPVLAERAHQTAGTLSGGEQQMLAIARGLMANPRLLLLDEPSLGLAPVAVTRMFDVLRDIRSQGVTMLLVEQNAYQALRLADRAYVLEAGQITRTGLAKGLLDDPVIRRAYLGGSVVDRAPSEG
jgi:branched-chain amino acid transport system ATP-binding protein